MSASRAFASSIDRQGTTFPLIRTKQYGELENACRAKRKATYVLLLNECEIKGADRFVALKDALARDVDFADVRDYVATKDGAKRAFHLSLMQSGMLTEAIDAVYESFTIVDAIMLVRDLVGFSQEDEPSVPFSDSTTGTPPVPSSDESIPEPTPAN